MYAIRSYYEPVEAFAGQAQGAVATVAQGQVTVQLHIGALRLAHGLPGLGQAAVRQQLPLLLAATGGEARLARITSYNVCYTKLLRLPLPTGA